MDVGLLHPGEMGAVVGEQLVRAGRTVSWIPEGRSAATATRAEQAGLTPAPSVDDASVVLSICPPHAALDVARSLAGTSALVIDANAVSPVTAAEVGATLGPGWVDGAIIGPPPSRGGTTRLYLSGPNAPRAAELFRGTLLQCVVLDGAPTAASALKMAYAAWTKGSAALLLATRSAARAHGVEDALMAEWDRSLPGLRERADAAAGSAARKAWRWSGEMDEVADAFDAAGEPAGFAQAAAEVYRRTGRST